MSTQTCVDSFLSGWLVGGINFVLMKAGFVLLMRVKI